MFEWGCDVPSRNWLCKLYKRKIFHSFYAWFEVILFSTPMCVKFLSYISHEKVASEHLKDGFGRY